MVDLGFEPSTVALEAKLLKHCHITPLTNAIVSFPNIRSQKAFPGVIIRDHDHDDDLVLSAALKGLRSVLSLGLTNPSRGFYCLFYRWENKA